jgi:hypothetical protein
VRCWPHHFDIATLIDRGAAADKTARSVGVGMEPGDDSYAEPYYYVNAYPPPAAGAMLPALAGDGSWHTAGWFGAVLPGSRLARSGQHDQVAAFLGSAVRACSRGVESGWRETVTTD